MAFRQKRDEMHAFDALGPLTRRVVSESPCMLDARKISDAAGIPLDQLGLYDEELSASIASMIEQEDGSVKRLKEDNGTGKLVIKGQRAPLLVFPGRDTPPPTLSEPVIQAGTLDGQLISIGGRDASVPARLQDGDTIYRLTTNRSVARQLAPHLYGNPVRVIGEGKWLRSDDGVWTLDIFKVLSMDALDDRPLSEVVDALRRIPNDYTADAWDELLRERDDGANAVCFKK